MGARVCRAHKRACEAAGSPHAGAFAGPAPAASPCARPPLSRPCSAAAEIKRAEAARAARPAPERAAAAWRKLQYDFPLVPPDELLALADAFRWAAGAPPHGHHAPHGRRAPFGRFCGMRPTPCAALEALHLAALWLPTPAGRDAPRSPQA